MIKHLMDRVIHRTRLDDDLGVWVKVVDGKAYIAFDGCEVVTLAEGDNLHVGLKAASASTFRHTATFHNSEVTSEPGTQFVSEPVTRADVARVVADKWPTPDVVEYLVLNGRALAPSHPLAVLRATVTRKIAEGEPVVTEQRSSALTRDYPAKKRRKKQRSRYLDPDAPLDTPSLDTSFHDHEMDV